MTSVFTRRSLWLTLGILVLGALAYSQSQPQPGKPPMDPPPPHMQPGGPPPGPWMHPSPPPASQPSMPLIGQVAPAFEAVTTQGKISFPHDFSGKWVVLFSHPADFTPVCTTEFMTFATAMPDFEAMNCQLIGLSVDSNPSHIAWLRTITTLKYKDMKDVVVTFPLIADIKMEIARQYGMIQPTASDAAAVRAVFVIDPAAKIRAIIYYPASTGRNIEEIKRLLISLQACDAHSVATPANWQPGEDVILPAPGSCGAAATRVNEAGKDYYCLDWFLCLKKMPKDQLKLPPSMK